MKRVSLPFLLVLGLLSACSAEADEDRVPVIQVKGEGRVQAEPDEAITTFGVKSEQKQLEKAYQDNISKMNAIVGTVKKIGVEARDIQTSSFSVQPVYGKDERGRILRDFPVGFRVDQQLTVRVRDLSQLGKLIDQVMTKGTNTFHGIQFSSSRIEALQKEAKQKAAMDARNNAKLLADSLDVKLGRLLRVSDVYYQPRPSSQVMMMSTRAEMAAAPQIEAGSLEVTASCNVEYEIA